MYTSVILVYNSVYNCYTSVYLFLFLFLVNISLGKVNHYRGIVIKQNLEELANSTRGGGGGNPPPIGDRVNHYH